VKQGISNATLANIEKTARIATMNLYKTGARIVEHLNNRYNEITNSSDSHTL